MTNPSTLRPVGRAAVAVLAAAATALALAPAASAHREDHRGDDRGRDARYTTTAGMPSPLVVAHRGASGYRTEHTLAAYELAVAMGADYIEPDLVATKDGALVDRHENEISGTTDVADRAEFADRKKTATVDGEEITGWFTEDFTLAEIKTLRTKERLPYRTASALYDGLYEVPTYAEVLELRAELSKKYGRTIGIIPEIKHPTYFQGIGLPMEAAVVKETAKHGLNRKTPRCGSSPSSSPTSWTSRPSTATRPTRRSSRPQGAPYDLAARGDARTYADLLTPASLRTLSESIDGIGPEKAQVIPRTEDGTLGSPTSLVDDAHAAGLKVIPWTFRNENTFLPADYRVGTEEGRYGRAIDEIVVFLKTGIDGFFTDQPDTGVVARAVFQSGR